MTEVRRQVRHFRLRLSLLLLAGLLPACAVLFIAVMFHDQGGLPDHRSILLIGLAVVLSAALSGMAVIWFGVGRRYGRRLRAVSDTAARFVAGDLSARVALAGRGAFFDELDFIAGAFNAMADALAEREQARQSVLTQLEASRELNTAILDSLTESIAVLDGRGCIVAVNARWCESARAGGADPRLVDSIGIDYLAACALPDEGESRPSPAHFGLEQVLARKLDCFAMEYPCAMADGVHHFELRMTPLRNHDGVVVAHEDITGRKHVAMRMERLVAELERSNRDLQDFAYVASHDLQEPLRKVSAFADRLRTGYGEVLDERGRDYLQRMTQAAVRMQALIDDLLQLSRVATRAQPLRAVALDAPLAEALADLDERIRTTAARVSVGPMPTIDADPTQMRQVFLNLIGNALKFVAPGARPEIEVGACETGDGRVQIRVCDRGIGLPDADRERVFAPFVRLHARTEYAGTGLGLAVVKRIVERHHGTVRALGREGGGTCFCFELPLRAAVADA